MTRDYIYITDTIKMVAETFEISSQEVYNLGSGLSYTINDIIYEISRVVKQPLIINYQPSRPTDIKNVSLDMTRFHNEFNIRAETSLHHGIFNTWNYVKTLDKHS